MAIFNYAQEIGLINEGVILNKVSKGYKQNKSGNNLEQILKQHSYPGLLHYVEKSKSYDDLVYLRKDYYIGMKQFNKIKERIELCEKLGDCKETSRFYKGIKKLYFDKGITSKDVGLTIQWYQEVYFPKLKEKIQETKQ